MIQIAGFLIAVIGTVLGVIGAWYTAAKERENRHFGFLCWIANSPMIVLSLIGIAAGWWTGLTAAALIPLNTLYFFTAVRGYLNTKGTRLRTKTIQTDPRNYTIIQVPGWDEK